MQVQENHNVIQRIHLRYQTSSAPRSRLDNTYAVVVMFVGAIFVWLAIEQLLRSYKESFEIAFRWIGAALMFGAGMILILMAKRLRRGLGQMDLFWRRIFFYRWLMAGWLGIFITLGMTIGNLDEARFVCRGACALWLSLCLWPVTWRGGWTKLQQQCQGHKLLRYVDLVLGNVILCLILGELGLRSLAAWKGEDSLLLFRSQGCRLQPGRQGNGQLGNSLGFPGPEFNQVKPNGTFRIAALGDSFSVATAVSYEDAYLTLLGRTWPGVEVLNFGVAGTGPKEYRLLLKREVWTYQPDLVLLPLFLGNDLLEPVQVPQLSRFNPNALYIELFMQRTYRLLREQFRLVGTSNSQVQEQTTSKTVSPISERTYREILARHVAICRTKPDRIDEQNWQDSLNQIKGIIDDCKQKQIPLVVVLIPDELQVNHEYFRQAWKDRGWPDQEYQVNYANERLAAFLSANQVPFLDLLPVIAPVGSKAYAPRDTHWNAMGNRMAADAIAQWLIDFLPADLMSSKRP